MDMETNKQRGGCLCGGVRYEVRGELRSVVGCHCSQCRRTSGNYVTATNCGLDDLVLEKDATLRWYRSSETAERGFCGVCGSNLFWRPIGGDHLSIMAGTLDTPTGLRVTKHIFVADKSDYYDLNDNAEKHAQW
ncbi:MAG: GFA family protein [Hyphomicrobiales bacterium]|nr:GFA family protein [Hyphomicrobiales bacterium]